MTIELKIGGYGKDRTGRVRGPFQISTTGILDNLFPFCCDGFTWRKNGEWDGDVEREKDIIALCDASGNPLPEDSMTTPKIDYNIEALKELKLGVRYVNRNGDISEPYTGSQHLKFGSSCLRYEDAGLYWPKSRNRRDIHDIIAEYVPPEPEIVWVNRYTKDGKPFCFHSEKDAEQNSDRPLMAEVAKKYKLVGDE